MAISREEVIWAYRMFFGREPESDDVIEKQMVTRNIADLRNQFIASREFRASNSILEVGRHRDVQAIKVETTATAEDLSYMASNIAREWRNFGQTEPHWSVLTGEQFRAENIENNIDDLYVSGDQEVSYIMSAVKRSGAWKNDGVRALDFGCGVGRLTLALAPHVSHITGIDISPAHLQHAVSRAEEMGVTNVSFQPIETIYEIELLSGFDLIISLIVLQHNPPPVMVELLRMLLSRLNEGGTAVLQMPTYIVGQDFSVADYRSEKQASMEMNAIPQRVVYQIVEQAGCRLLEVREDGYMDTDIGLSHTFVIQKRA